MAFERRDFSGNAVKAKLTSDITASSVSIEIDGATGWPTGANGKFVVTINRDLPNEEKLLVQTRSGTTLAVASSGDRGTEGTTAQSHPAGADVEHTIGEVDADEANYTAHETVGLITTKGDTLVGTGANTFVRFPVGANNTVPTYDTAQSTGIATRQVNENMLSTSVAGAGLVGGNGTALAWNPDGTTLEISSDVARLKDAAVTTAKLASTVVDNASLEIAGGNMHAKALGITNAMLAGSIATTKLVLPAWTTFTPTWASTVGIPALGNGTVAAAYSIFGKQLSVRMHYTFGTSSTFGGTGGEWSFGIAGGQTSIAADQTVSAMILGPGSVRYAAVGLINASSSSIQRVAVSDGTKGIGNYSPATPFAWGNGTQIVITGTFEIA